ncbi:MAG: ATP-binding protein [Gammaproteobacteria bacterium]|jgi:two-component system sensor histidine kinase PilS (NtrC family)
MSVTIDSALRGMAGDSAATNDADDLPWRVLRLLNTARWILSAALIVLFYLLTDPRVVGGSQPFVAASALTALIVLASIELVFLHRRLGRLNTHVYCQGLADIALVTTLMHASGGITTGFGALLVISIGCLSLLLRTTIALFFAALATIALLTSQAIAVTQGITSSAEFTNSGILGAVIFSIVAATQILRSRVIESEALAAQRGVDLRNLVELNDYIIQHLRESIVVVDRNDQIRLINESALKQLGATAVHEGMQLFAVSHELSDRLNSWRARREERRSDRAFSANDGSSRLEPHFARLGPERDGGVLIFLEDTSLIAERVQQTKLAALGRLSASIAHEIRNPLGALSHAGQLLGESDNISASDVRLTEIIRVNSQRVSNIVESILSLSRGDKTTPQHIELSEWSQAFVGEFVSTMELFEGSVILSADSSAAEVEIDPTHLHQVVWNLCDNAVKYASLEAGAIAVELRCGQMESTGRPFLEIADRGAGIPEEIVEHVFEPFFTAQAGGTGLGLYISRELCERNGSALSYHPRPGGGSVFRIMFSDPRRWQNNRETA